MSINSDDDKVDTELIEVLAALVRVVSRVLLMTQAQDDPTLAALLTRAYAVLERLTDVSTLKDIQLQWGMRVNGLPDTQKGAYKGGA